MLWITVGINLGFILLCVWWFWQRSEHCLQRVKRCESCIAVLRKETRINNLSNVGMGQRVTDLESELQAVEHRQEGLLKPSEQSPYQQAAKLLELGVEPEEVMSTCQLTRGEAELIQTMYHMKKQTQEL